MHISNERYFHERQRHDLALRMIRHEARTCTIRSCTGLDRRSHPPPLQDLREPHAERTGAPTARQIATTGQLLRAQRTRAARIVDARERVRDVRSVAHAVEPARSDPLGSLPVGSIEFGRLFCDAYETHRQLLRNADISFEHAWFLLQLLSRNARPARGPLPTLRQSVPAGSRQRVSSRVPGVRAEANGRGTTLIQSRAWRCRALVPTCWLDRISNAPRTGARTKSVCARRSPIRRRCSCRSGTRAALS